MSFVLIRARVRVRVNNIFLPSKFYKSYHHHTREPGVKMKDHLQQILPIYHVVKWSHDKWKWNVIVPLPRGLWLPNLTRRYPSDKMALSRKSHNPLITWTHQVIWQVINLYNSQVTNKKTNVSIPTWLMATSLDKVTTYDIGAPYTKSHESLITWTYVAHLISWQIINIISPIPQFLWTLKLIG